MDNKIEVLREEIKQKLDSASDLAEIDKARVEYLGKKGSITALLKGMKNLSKGIRVEIIDNEVRADASIVIKSRRYLICFSAIPRPFHQAKQAMPNVIQQQNA